MLRSELYEQGVLSPFEPTTFIVVFTNQTHGFKNLQTINPT